MLSHTPMVFVNRPAGRVSWLLGLALCAFACGQSDGVPSVQNVADAGNGPKPSYPEPGWTRAEALCRPRERAIESWIDGFRHCERDADCEVTEIAANCVGSFLCPTVLSTNIDRAAFERAAAEKEAEYVPECGCALADCTSAIELAAFCSPITKRCDTRNACAFTDGGMLLCNGKPHPNFPGNTLDAGTTDAATNDASAADASASSDAGTGSGGDAGVDPFACKVAADCAVKNVGNCCGYYPRCANKAAVFTPTACEPGLSGVCGYTEIDECACRDNTCRSLQGGKEI